MPPQTSTLRPTAKSCRWCILWWTHLMAIIPWAD